MISEKSRMASVKAAEKYPIQTEPKTLEASPPASAAPPVLATVFSERIAAIGRSTWARSVRSIGPLGRPARSRTSICESGTE